ncbi:extracellular serine/threonine protein CG31145-like [Scylla paramamosain]|uniref:extracellular serine/threonine protein CG31145-like n=1 Tax=Scylla paramamosain TaxID=85552 RepID=UPI003082D39A
MKLKKRIILAAVTSTVLVTVVLLLDVENRLSYPGNFNVQAEVPVKYSFRQRHLQRMSNGSRDASLAVSASGQLSAASDDPAHPSPAGGEAVLGEDPSVSKDPQAIGTEPPDPYLDLQEIVAKVKKLSKRSGRAKYHWNPTVGELLGRDSRENATLWDNFHLSISQDELYGARDPTVNRLLQYMTTLPISHISQKEGGTQIKLTIEFIDGGRALFKPMRHPREQQTLKNQFYFTDFERHNAEIAAFHLDRLLGFRRAVPTMGRTVNITRELYMLAKGDLLKTFFFSPEKNHCFHGKCSYFCDTAHAICGSPDMLEGSFAVFLPGDTEVPRVRWRHPWRRSYSRRRKAQWEEDNEYCKSVKETHPYSEGRRLLDIVDMSILDFLMGNMDRHHYETIKMFGNNSAPLHLDHGRGFGKAFHDEVSILAPLYQCCVLRHSTLASLLRFHTGPERLSSAMLTSMASDPLQPVLWPPHLAALDRRLNIVLQVTRRCLEGAEDPYRVIIEDFH